jgi:hypothetical protein
MKGRFFKSAYEDKGPREGTRIRAIYDMFKAKPGLPIRFNVCATDHVAFTQLRDFYGFDIRRVDPNKRGMLILAGEWFGSRYRDYVEERLTGKLT